MTVCLTCIRRNKCNVRIKDDEHMVGCTGYIESRTNFERVTESPEALAEFIHEAESMYERCCKGDLRCDYCKCQWCGLAGRKDLIDWLNEECTE